MNRMTVLAVAMATAVLLCAGCASYKSAKGDKKGGTERFLTDQSRLIEKVEYDQETREMRVQMAHSSDWYVYQDVPPELYRAFSKSGSKGAFFAKEVKGRFPGRREE